MRSTSGSSSARLVITAEVCGSRSIPMNVAPPLKSTSTKFSTSDECVNASPSTSVRSSSLLPEPVAPISIPCGPIPPCADSLMSSSTGLPSSATPIGTFSRSQGERDAHSSAGSKVRGSPAPSRAVSSMSVASGSADSTDSPIRYGATSRDSARQRTRESASGRPTVTNVSLPVRSAPTDSTLSAATRSRSVSRSAFHRSAPETSSTTTLRRPASAIRAPIGTCTSSSTTTTYGSSFFGTAPGSNRGRSLNSVPSIRSSSR